MDFEDIEKEEPKKEPQSKKSKLKDWFVTYGWAILVVLAAIGALWYFDILTPDNFIQNQPQDCKCPACNYNISISNTTPGGLKVLTCCVNATWNKETKSCDYINQTARIRILQVNNNG
jgi:hypothetical protein